MCIPLKLDADPVQVKNFYFVREHLKHLRCVSIIWFYARPRICLNARNCVSITGVFRIRASYLNICTSWLLIVAISQSSYQAVTLYMILRMTVTRKYVLSKLKKILKRKGSRKGRRALNGRALHPSRAHFRYDQESSRWRDMNSYEYICGGNRERALRMNGEFHPIEIQLVCTRSCYARSISSLVREAAGRATQDECYEASRNKRAGKRSRINCWHRKLLRHFLARRNVVFVYTYRIVRKMTSGFKF